LEAAVKAESAKVTARFEKEIERTRKEGEKNLEYFKAENAKAAERFDSYMESLAKSQEQSDEFLQDMVRMREEDRKDVAFMRDQITSLTNQLIEANKPGFIRRIWRKIF